MNTFDKEYVAALTSVSTGGMYVRTQAPDVHWTYEVRGVVPVYKPPSSGQKCGAVCVEPRRTKSAGNFLHDNMRLVTTAASSPVKGRRLVATLTTNTRPKDSR